MIEKGVSDRGLSTVKKIHLAFAMLLLLMGFFYVTDYGVGITGLASFEENIPRTKIINQVITERTTLPISLEAEPTSLYISGMIDGEGEVTVFVMDGSTLRLVYTSKGVHENFTFDTQCLASCNLVDFNKDLNLIVDISGATLQLDEVVYTVEVKNERPKWIGESTLTIEKGHAATLNLNTFFIDEDGDELTYLATSSEDIHVQLEGASLTLLPESEFEGETSVTIIASDLKSSTQKTVSFTIGDAISIPDPILAETKVSEDVEREVLFNGETKVMIVLNKEASPFTTSPLTGAVAADVDEVVQREEKLEEQKAKVKRVQDKVLDELTVEKIGDETQTLAVAETPDLKLERQYDALPAIAGTITQEGLDKLRANPDVLAIIPDREIQLNTDGTIGIVNADDANTNTLNGIALDGKGSSVCVIDSGIDADHAAFGNRVLYEECYCAITDLGQGGCCPNQQSTDVSAEDDYGHGTLAAGIIASGDETFLGVAPKAGIAAIKTFNTAGAASTSDIAAALDSCISNSTQYNISVISMSFGSNVIGAGNFDKSATGFNDQTLCDDPSSDVNVITQAINLAAGLGIVSVASSGNNGFGDGISYPACLSNVISVGATSNADGAASFSNSDELLDLYAPGVDICSARAAGGNDLGGGGSLNCNDNTFMESDGTSFSAPHVSGTALLLKQIQKIQGKNRSVNYTKGMLTSTAEITVTKNDVTKPRLDALNAVVKHLYNLSINKSQNRIESPNYGYIAFDENTDFGVVTNCIEVGHNKAGVSDACPQYNKSARIQLRGLDFTNPKLLMNGLPCPGEVCSNQDYNGGILSFDVEHFSVFNATEGNTSICGNVTGSINLTDNVVDPGTCFFVTTDDVVIDCNGFSITGNRTDFGINVTGARRVTIQECNINNFTSDIFLHDTENVRLINNTFESFEFLNATNTSIEEVDTAIVRFPDNITAGQNFGGDLVWNESNNPSGSDDGASDIAIGSDGVFIALTNASGAADEGWLVEKRNLTNGALIAGFGNGGRAESDPTTTGDFLNAIAYDDDSLYLVGSQDTPGFNTNQHRIEKRNATTGALIGDFGAAGIIIVNVSEGIGDSLRDVVVFGNDIYIAGELGAPDNALDSQWFVQRRNKNTAANIWNVTENFSTTFDRAFGIAVDNSGVYLAGVNSSSGGQWAIEKRALADGSIVWNASFDLGGAISHFATDVALDGSGAYFVGRDPNNAGQWRIEKRSKTDGSLIWTAAQDFVAGRDDFVQDIAVDTTGVYIAGFDGLPGAADDQLRIQKRDLNTGNLSNDFGDQGNVSFDTGDTDQAAAIALDGADGLYIAGIIDGGDGVTLVQKYEKLGIAPFNDTFNLSLNFVFVNSTLDDAFENITAEITLFNITSSDPQPLVDLNDDGIFEVCQEPQCVEVSFAGGVFIFNVSNFTGYSSNETGIFGNLSCRVTNNSACFANETDVLHLANLTNSHVELPNGTDFPNRVCCIDLTGQNNITNDSSGFNFLDLSNFTNAQAELPFLNNYNFEAFIGATNGVIECNYQNTDGNCGAGQTCLVTLSSNSSGQTNLHVADCVNAPYNTSVCCGFSNGTIFQNLACAPRIVLPGQNVTCNATIFDDDGIQQVLANVTLPNGTQENQSVGNVSTLFSFNFTNTVLSGQHNVTWRATDGNGVLSQATDSFKVDAVAPNVTPHAPPNGSFVNGTSVIEVAANVTDDVAVSNVTANITLPNGTVVTLALLPSGEGDKFNTSFTVPNVPGEARINFTANDSVGRINHSITNFTIIQVDLQTPNITIVGCNPNPATEIGINVTCNATVVDDLSLANVSANVTLPNGTTRLQVLSNISSQYFFNITTEIEGLHNVTWVANDSAGNVTVAADNFTVVLINVTALGCDPFRVVENQNTTCNVTVTSNALDNVSANVTLPNGTIFVIQMNNFSTNFFFNFSSNLTGITGNYSVLYIANDTNGQIAAANDVFKINTPPVLANITTQTIDEDNITSTFNLTNFSFDVEGDNLTFFIVAENTSQVDCNITEAQNDTVLMVPASDFVGNATCTAIASDGLANSSNASFNITVLASNNSRLIDSVFVNSTIFNSTKINSTIINSTIINSFNVNGTIINSTEQDSLINQSIVNQSLVNNSNLQNSDVFGSTIINSTKFNSSIINSTVINSTNFNSNITGSTEDNSLVNNSNLDNSTANNSIVLGSDVNDSILLNSNKSNSIIIQSTVINSSNDNATIINVFEAGSTINDSEVRNGTVNDSILLRSFVNDSTIVESNKTLCTISSNSIIESSINFNCTLINVTERRSRINDSNVTNSLVEDTVIDPSTLINVTAINSTITNSLKINARLINATIVNSNNSNVNITDSNETNSNINNSRINDTSSIIASLVLNSTVSRSSVTSSTVINCTVINSTLVNFNCLNQVLINFVQGAGGGGGGAGGGGAGGGGRNLFVARVQQRSTDPFDRVEPRVEAISPPIEVPEEPVEPVVEKPEELAPVQIPICGDGRCENGESIESCPEDCFVAVTEPSTIGRIVLTIVTSLIALLVIILLIWLLLSKRRPEEEKPYETPTSAYNQGELEQQLETYVKTEIGKGFKKAEIRHALLMAGHSPMIVEKILSQHK